MARMKSFMQMTGSMAMVSMYTRLGSDEVIIRTKGGPKKRHIKTKPQFEAVRRNNSEWAGCTKMASQIRSALERLKHIEDYPVNGALNAICKEIQKLDSAGEHGKRSVLLSEHKEMLLGFSLSRKQVLESVLRVPLEYTLNRETGLATISIPAFNADMYLYNFRKLPYYRIIACFSGVSDMMLNESGREYEHKSENCYDRKDGVFCSEWLPAMGWQEALDISLIYYLEPNPVPDYMTLMLSVGVEFGQKSYGDITEPVKYSGTAKIIKVG